MVYVAKLGSLVAAGPDGAAVGWPAAIVESAAVIGVTRVPIAGPRRSTGPWPLAGLAKPVMAQLNFFRGVGSQCPSDLPELDRGVRPNLAIPFWHASAQQRGHAKPGDALLACQRSTGGVTQSLAMNFGGPALHMGVVPSLAMLSGSQRSIGACTNPGDAPLTGQCSTEELR